MRKRREGKKKKKKGVGAYDRCRSSEYRGMDGFRGVCFFLRTALLWLGVSLACSLVCGKEERIIK